MNFDYELEPGRFLKKLNKVEKQEEPVISIITPFYNTKENLIMGTANSILNQTYPFFEWLIIDDGSTNEESLKVLENIEKMDKRIKVFHKENEGLAQTRDYGAKMACESSKYLLFIDDDDQIIDTFVECAYWTLETNKEASWAYADSLGFGAQEYIWRKWYNPIKETKENQLVSINFIRKKDFFEAGGYELKVKNVYEDWNFWLKLIALEKYPVKMSFLGLWYRRKAQNDGELARAKANHQKAMEYINETSKKIKNVKEAIQYPKQDYNWDFLADEVKSIKTPILEKDNKIKILMIVPWMVTGGGDRFNLDLVKNINKDKFEIIIISTLPSDNEWRQQFEQYSTVYDLTSFLDRKYWLSFINYIIKKNNINLIFNTCSQFGYNVLPYLKEQYPQVPIVDYVHMEEWYWRNGGYSRDSAAFASVIDKTLVCNKNSEKILVEHFGKNESEVQTVYIGVDENKYNPELYSRKEILNKLQINAENKYIFAFICRIAGQKRPYLLLEIIKKLKAQRDDFIVVIVGDGPMLKEMKDRANQLNLKNNIVFLGNCTNTQEIYAISDITLNCSIKEGIALTSYESLAMGVPVVSSDVGGQKELIDNHVGRVVKCYQKETEINQYNYKEEEVNQYVEAIQELLKDLNKYKQNCREKILEGFTIKNMVSNMEKIFIDTVQVPNKEKVQNGLNLKSLKLSKELLISHIMGTALDYEWLVDEFNNKNVDRDYRFEKKSVCYEHTLEYKIKHPIVIILRKIGIYEFCKKIVGKE